MHRRRHRHLQQDREEHPGPEGTESTSSSAKMEENELIRHTGRSTTTPALSEPCSATVVTEDAKGRGDRDDKAAGRRCATPPTGACRRPNSLRKPTRTAAVVRKQAKPQVKGRKRRQGGRTGGGTIL